MNVLKKWFNVQKLRMNDVEFNQKPVVEKGAKGAKGRRPHGTGDAENYFQDSMDIATYFGVSLVPREYAAYEDRRWDLIMQGLGLETIVVHNCRELANFISQCGDPMQRAKLQRLYRSLQTLMVMFQSKDPNLWIDAADNVMGWLKADRDWSYFEAGSTEGGSHHEEGEEEERSDDDDIDPPDRRPVPNPDDDDDGDRGGPAGGDGATSRPSSWDYVDS
eukprot:s348_g6.t1